VIEKKALQYFYGNDESSEDVQWFGTSAYDGKGRLIFIETSGIPFFDGQGKLLGYRGVSRDVSERKKAEEELRQSQAKLEYSKNLETC